MKTTYITLKPDMARAYREGRKCMTRRVIKWPKWIRDCDYSINRIAEIINSNEYRGIIKRGNCDGVENQYRCPYGKPGDQIILGTTWAVPKEFDHLKPTELPLTDGWFFEHVVWSYFDSDEKPEGFGKLRPARFLPKNLRDRMPRETLTTVRAERVQEISSSDAIDEGVGGILTDSKHPLHRDIYKKHGHWTGNEALDIDGPYAGAVDAFTTLWNAINLKRGYSWESNPWVWVLGW